MGGIFSANERVTKNERKEDREHGFRSFLKSVRNWHIFVVMIPMFFMTATFLRFDHIRMAELLSEVKAADAEIAESENLEETEKRLSTALYNLRYFVSHHIVVNFIEDNGVQTLHFGTGPFYLENLYHHDAAIKLAEAEKKAAEISDDNPNGNVFAKAMAVCQPKAHQYGWDWNTPAYIQCYYDVIYSFPTQDSLTTTIVADIPDTALYRHDLLSPVWYPSVSGWMVLVCAVLCLIFMVRAIWWIILQIAIRIVS